MRVLFYVLVGVTLFFSLSVGRIIPAIVVNHDKFAHFVVFFVLSFCMNISFPKYPIKNLVVIMGSLALGIELLQYLLSSRDSSIGDLGASMAGIFVYLMLWRCQVIFSRLKIR